MASLSRRLSSEQLATRFAVTAACLVVWRVLAAIPLPITVLHQGPYAIQSVPIPTNWLDVLASSPLETRSVTAIGLNPFLGAFALFWFWGFINPKIRRLRNEPAGMRHYLVWLTAILASVQAIGLTLLLAGDDRALVTSTAGLLTISTLVFGTIAMLYLGRVIDEFGVPSGYGVWFLYGASSLFKGVHHLARWITLDTGDRSRGFILIAFALVTIGLLISTAIAMEAVRPIIGRLTGGKGEHREHTAAVFHLLPGGLVVPVVVAATLMSSTFQLVDSFGGPALRATTIWAWISPLQGPGFGYHLGVVAVLVIACMLVTNETVDAEGLASRLRRKGVVVADIAPGNETARYLRGVSLRLSLVGGLWLAFVVEIAPVAFQLALGRSHSGPTIGGGPFVVAASIFITAGSRLRRQISR